MKTIRALTTWLALVAIPCAWTQAQEPSGPNQPHPLSWNVEGVQREALVFEPTSGSPEEKHPVIFAFHDSGGNMQGFADLSRLHSYWPAAIIVYPQGLDTSSLVDPHSRKPGWQKLAGEDGDRDLEFVDAMLATLHYRYHVDDRRIFATGYSNGAYFSLLLWNQRSNAFSGFSIVAGATDLSEHMPAAKPVLQISGRTDPLVTPDMVDFTISEERRIDGAYDPGEPCGDGCTQLQGVNAGMKVIWHPGAHVYPPFASGTTVAFFRQASNAATAGSTTLASAVATPAPVTDPSQGQVVQYESHGLSLTGYVYKPPGDGPFPVYLWNHGSERDPKPGALLAQFWVAKGFVLFAPIRSGHGSNPGPWIGDLQRRVPDQQSAEGYGQLVALHERENDDVIAAYRWIARQPYVDSHRIVVAGGSYGGIQTLLTAERDAREHLGVKCFVAMSPAAESWANPNWAGRLTRAISNARAPIFLLQARNDYSLGPSAVLGPVVDSKGAPNRHRIFPDHGDPNDHAQGHGGFFSDANAWGPDVVDYLRACGEIAAPTASADSVSPAARVRTRRDAAAEARPTL